MNQEQLSLEVCQEIGHLFPESRLVYAESNVIFNEALIEKTQITLMPRKSEGYISGYKEIANHPSITDMRNKLWDWGDFLSYRIIDVGFNAWYLQCNSVKGWVDIKIRDHILDPKEHEAHVIEADSIIEAYAEAVKLVKGREG